LNPLWKITAELKIFLGDTKKPEDIKTFKALLQQQASTRLQFSAKKTMLIAQQLYEGIDIGKEGSVGLITYMRTDSFHISGQALTSCRKLITDKYGQNYLPEKPNVHASNKKGTQGAHEAIRPTSVEYTPESIKDFLTKDQYKLYELIWNRFVASQMKPAFYPTASPFYRGISR